MKLILTVCLYRIIVFAYSVITASISYTRPTANAQDGTNLLFFIIRPFFAFITLGAVLNITNIAYVNNFALLLIMIVIALTSNTSITSSHKDN